ncbi:LysM peptidoglycan-binding domain-containing protein [Virgisporangium aurantiacum]|uniref:LysM peptidoglycan-binding domain-containing protein n=1 Tax=Virgisporangium aurantiacum TaxID=175570 RepID=UPI00194ECF8A|nr:LysM peptidoglycan-binding domain-containing protein [Virgisporangium aurantiacum]
MLPLTRGRRARRSRAAAGSAGWARDGIVERHLRLVAWEGEAYPAPRRPADDGQRRHANRGTDWLGDRFGGDGAGGRSGLWGDVTDERPADRAISRTYGGAGAVERPEGAAERADDAVERDGDEAGAGPGAAVEVRAGSAGQRQRSGVTDARRPGGAEERGSRAAGARRPGMAEERRSGVAGDGRPGAAETRSSRAAGAGRPGVAERPGGAETRSARAAGARRPAVAGGRRPGRRPVRLTRRGRLVVLALVLLFTGALVGFLSAVPGQAADPPRPAVTAVVQPGDTLWSFAERNLPGWQPRAGVAELRKLNDLEGYVIHPGQRLALPARR